MHVVMPNYHHGLMNLMSSILHHYQIQSSYCSLSKVDERLQPGQPIMLLLIDGMGANLLKRHLPADSFLRTHIVDTITTVFPSTTVAATTAVNSAVSPRESAWVGWFLYFKEIQKHVVMFLSKDQYTGEPVSPNYAYQALPYENIQTKMQVKGYRTTEIYPAFAPNGVCSMDEMCERILEYAQSRQYDYVYGYWDEFDTLMHHTGVDSKDTKAMLEHIDVCLASLYEKLPTSHQLIVIADHGQINTEDWYLMDHPDLCACLRIKPACEIRTIVFYVKEGMESKFECLFEQYYGQYFKLVTSRVFMDEYLGKGERHTRLCDVCGDYVAIAIDRYNLVYEQKNESYVGQHAGLTEDEMWISVIMK